MGFAVCLLLDLFLSQAFVSPAQEASVEDDFLPSSSSLLT